MPVLAEYFRHKIPVVSNNEFIGMCGFDSNKKSLLAEWLRERTKELEDTQYFASYEYTRKLYRLIPDAKIARLMMDMNVILLPWSSKQFDLAAVSLNWDFPNTVYTTIKREYPLQVVVPNKGGRPILAVDVDLVDILAALPNNHPMSLYRVFSHELVHLRDIKDGALWVEGNTFYYNGVRVKRFTSKTGLARIEEEIAMSHELPAYQSQLRGLNVDITNPLEIAQFLANNRIPIIEDSQDESLFKLRVSEANR